MARLHVLGDWHGPGEEKAARSLAESLPREWDVVAGRQIPDPMGAVDLDLVIIGLHAVFVCEEKAWGRHVEVGEVSWYVDGDRRHNPANQVAHATRVLAGRLRTKVVGWTSAQRSLPRGRRPVSGHVVLSHDRLVLRGADELGDDVVLRLDDAASRLVAIDSEFPAAMAPLRQGVISYLLGLGERSKEGPPQTILQYHVLGSPVVNGNARVYPTLNPAGEHVGLYCVPIIGATDSDAAARLATREHDALVRLSAKDRTWRVQGWFDWEGYRVTPVLVDMSAESLGRLAAAGRPEPDDTGRVPVEIARHVVSEAFQALADVHAEGVTHRALQMRSVELHPDTHRVRFRDFSRAHLPSTETIAGVLDSDHGSAGFQPPGTGPEHFQPRDDVYALALCLVQWLHGDATDQPDHDMARALAAAYPEVGQVLAEGMALAVDDRPEAADVVRAVRRSKGAESEEQEPAASPIVEMEENALVNGRFRLLRRLGEGAWAVTWLAWDETVETHRTLKHLHGHRSGFDQVLAEYRSADWLHSRYCARVYDVLAHPEPGVLVQEYIPGQSLRDLAHADRRLDQEQCRRIAVDILRGLADAHEQMLYHRDVSPNNIIVRDDGSAALIDFGLSARAEEARSAVGSPPYTAPEVILRRHWSPAADIYSASVSLLEVMLGHYPFAGTAMDERRRVVRPSVQQEQYYGQALLFALFEGASFESATRPQDARAFADRVMRARDTSRASGRPVHNPTVAALRGLYRLSDVGNAGNRGMDDPFAYATYVQTRLDTELLPAITRGDLDVVVLSGNPGDGKTSYLVQVGEELDASGATTLHSDAAGWKKRLGARTFAAVYDASESHGQLSADELLRQALDSDEDEHTVLLAANDGRVVQFFLNDHAERYPEIAEELARQQAGEPASGRIVLVDLKRRALALPSGSGIVPLGENILASLTGPERWSSCDECIARAVCPVRGNVELLRGNAARSALSELLLISHLRRRRRATVRDLRSALAWLITGDLDCGTVHSEHGRGQDPGAGPYRRTPDLAFAPDSGDYLVQEWAELDPAVLPAPAVARAARADRRLIPDLSAVEHELMGSLKRALFFGGWTAPTEAHREVRGYRYLDEYLAALRDPAKALGRIALGVSRLLAYPGYDDPHLALRDRAFDDPSVRAIVVVKELPVTDFRLRATSASSSFVESFADQMILIHVASNAQLRVSLDVAELLLRTADGELVGDTASAALRQEIEGFGNRLRLQPARSVRVVDGSGRAVGATVIDGGRIALEDR
ncbi:protein kinase [Actinomycetospora endophytica]|uniref:Protein kinase n=1 Tax=Actinomycetospora endophytica TaxID=2291215 RepID=A0ABS8PHZ8_9PSEU|nr:protein kinase [Actinomycetospora endophytica]MCD2197896.1 protein kinase [Actinomycetospora endophytica]